MKCAKEALFIIENDYGSDHFYVSTILVRLARVHMANRDQEQALETLSQALKISSEVTLTYLLFSPSFPVNG